MSFTANVAGASKPGSSSLGEHRLFARENMVPFILVTALFFLWGIPNNLNDVLIRQFMKSFEISRFQAGEPGFPSAWDGYVVDEVIARITAASEQRAVLEVVYRDRITSKASS
jgi:hypothetical protein